MRKGLIAASVLAGALLFSTVGCNQTPSKPVDKSVYTVSIDNKEELQAEWLSDDPGRSLSITITKDGVEQNATKAIQDGDLTFNVANTTVAKINGKVVSPVGEGTTTVTANYKNVSDSVQITITYSDPHGKSADDPLSVAEAVAICQQTGETQTNIEYYVSGIVSNVGDPWNPQYENITFDVVDSLDAKDVWVRCYRVVKADGAEFDPTKIALGSEVLVKGYLVNYKGNTPEMPQGSQILSATEGQQAQTIVATVAEALAVAMALDANSSTNDKYVVTGYITAVKAGSGFYMSDTKGAVDPSKDQFLVYYGNNAMPADATVNAKVKVTAPLKHYVSSSNPDNYAYETSGSKPEAYELLEAGDTPVPPSPATEVTVAQAKEIIAALEDGATTEELYAVTGFVTAKQDKATYASYDYWLGETAETTKENSIQVFRGLLDADYDKMAVGDEVVVTGNLQKYIKNEQVIPEIKNSSWEKAGDVPPAPTAVTVAQAKEIIAALEDGATTEEQYAVSGFVTAKQDKATYASYDYWLGEAATSTKEESLQVFRGLLAEDYDNLAVGDEVVVTGQLQKYIKNEQVIPEIKNSTWTKDGGEVPPEPPVEGEVTVNFSAADLITDPDNYTGGSVKLTTQALDSVLSVSVSATDGNSGKIYKSNDYGFQIRLYNSGSAKFVATVKSGYVITSAVAVYAAKGSNWWVQGAETEMTIADDKLSASIGSGDCLVYSVVVTYAAVQAA